MIGFGNRCAEHARPVSLELSADLRRCAVDADVEGEGDVPTDGEAGRFGEQFIGQQLLVTQTVFAAPMVVLYLVGIVLAFFAAPGSRKERGAVGEPRK